MCYQGNSLCRYKLQIPWGGAYYRNKKTWLYEIFQEFNLSSNLDWALLVALKKTEGYIIRLFDLHQLLPATEHKYPNPLTIFKYPKFPSSHPQSFLTTPRYPKPIQSHPPSPPSNFYLQIIYCHNRDCNILTWVVGWVRLLGRLWVGSICGVGDTGRLFFLNFL